MILKQDEFSLHRVHRLPNCKVCPKGEPLITSRTEKTFLYIYAILSAIILFLACKTLTDTELFRYIMWSDRAIFRARLEPLEQFGAEIGRQFFPQRIPGPVYLWLTSVFFPEGQEIGRGWQIINILSIGSVIGLAIAVYRRFSLLAGLVTISLLLGNLMMTSSLTRTYWNPSWLMIATCGLLTAALLMWRQKSVAKMFAGALLAASMIVVGISSHLTFFIPAILISLALITDAALYRHPEMRKSWSGWLITQSPLTVVMGIGVFWSVTLDFSNIQPSGEENAVTFLENLTAIAMLLADHANINFTDNIDSGNYLSAAKYFTLYIFLNSPNYLILLLAICAAVAGSWRFLRRNAPPTDRNHPVFFAVTLALLVILLISSTTFTAKPRYIYYLWVSLSVAFAAGAVVWLHRTSPGKGFTLAGYGLLFWSALANIYNHLLISDHYHWTEQQHTATLQTYQNTVQLVDEIRAHGLPKAADIRMGASLFLDVGGSFRFIDSNQTSAIDVLIGYDQSSLSEPASCLAVFVSDKTISPEIAAGKLRQQLAKHGAESVPTDIRSSGNRIFITYPPYQGACLRTLANYYTDRYLFRKLMSQPDAAGPFRIDSLLPVELGISFRTNDQNRKTVATVVGDLNGYRGFMTPYAERLVLEMRHEQSGVMIQRTFPEIIGLEGFMLPLTASEIPQNCGKWTATLKVFGFGYVETTERSDHSFTDTVQFCD